MSDQENNDSSLKKKKFRRRSFLGSLFGGAAAVTVPGLGASGSANASGFGWSSSNYPKQNYATTMEAVVIGSGFGGAVTSCRLSKKWPGKVMIVERGKRYKRGEFPRTVPELMTGFWNLPGDDVPRIIPNFGETRGVFDLRSYNHLDVLTAAGWGGGSLLYANALIKPLSPTFDANWPATIKQTSLQPYYTVHSSVMGARTVPRGPEPERALADRYTTSATVASGEGIQKYALNVGVFFGKDLSNPTPLGQNEVNQHGAMQTSCTYCAECPMGCNYGAKTSLDYNYLYVAENKYSAITKTEHMVDKIVPLNAFGLEDSFSSGDYGYAVYMVDLVNKVTIVVKTKRVIVAAGVFGTNEILLRNKTMHLTLPNISGRLGQGFSSNGDFFNFALFTQNSTGASAGPTIVEYIDYNEKNGDPTGFIAEQMALPFAAIANLLQVLQPTQALQDFVTNIMSATGDHVLTQFTIGKDSSDGQMSLDWFTKGLRLNWPQYNNYGLYNKMIDAAIRAKNYLKAQLAIFFPTWITPLERNLSVHPLGGCAMADSVLTGVVSAKRGEMGRVFNYKNLYVADGSIIPSAVGVNPALTIGTIAEMIAEDITGIAPTTTL